MYAHLTLLRPMCTSTNKSKSINAFLSWREHAAPGSSANYARVSQVLAWGYDWEVIDT